MNEPPSDTSSVANGRSGQQYLQPSSTNSPQPRTKSSTAPFRRPFGCAVLDVSQFVKGAEDSLSRPREVTMQIFVPTDEASFATLHEDIIHSRTSQFERSHRSVHRFNLGTQAFLRPKSLTLTLRLSSTEPT